MEKPIKYRYRIQSDIRNALNTTPEDRSKWGKPYFWVERQSFIGSTLDGEWFKCGTEKTEERHDKDWGWYESTYTVTRYFDTSKEAKEWIDEQLAKYPTDLALYEKWEAGREARERKKMREEKRAKKAKEAFERDNMIGMVFE